MLKNSRWMTVAVCGFLLCMTLFMSFGYARLSDNLKANVTANVKEPQMVYIKDVHVFYSNNLNGTPSVKKTGFVFYQHGNYSLKPQQSNAGGLVTVEVTVRNHSGVVQYFAGHTSTPALPDGCVVSYQDIKLGDALQVDEIKTFRIMIQNTNWWNTYSLNGYESMLKFAPDFDESFTENASRSIAEIFANVLGNLGVDGNGQGIYYKGQYYAPNKIVQLLRDNMESVDTGGYIGNVGDASQDQKDLIAAIFGDDILMEMGNQIYSVSLLIKNQQIDGQGENDMVLYVTADQLAVGSGNWQNNAWKNLNNVPVYGLIYINNGGSNYTYCDHLFVGEAPVCNFGGAFGSGNIGNFNTNLWNSTEYPSVTDSSNGQITQDYITKDGELDDAYRYYLQHR